MSFMRQIFGRNKPVDSNPNSDTPQVSNGPVGFGRKILVSSSEAIASKKVRPSTISTDQKTAESIRLRAEFMGRAGPFLRPSLEFLFDNGWSYSMYQSACGILKHHSADKSEHGKALALMLDWLIVENRHEDLQKVCRRQGQWPHEYTGHFLDSPSVHLRYFCFELAKEELYLPDPDGDSARMIYLLRQEVKISKYTSRKLLRAILKILQAYPDGKLATALHGFVNYAPFSDWRADIEAALHESAPSHGETQGTVSLVASLPPLELPDLGCGYYAKTDALVKHFSNLFEPRLYTELQNQFLSTFSGRHADWLREKREILRPLMCTDPEILRKLASLARKIESKAEPSANWIEEARYIFSSISSSIWLDLFGNIASCSSLTDPDIGYGTRCGSYSEHYLRTIIYFTHFLPARQVGPLLANYALRKCYVTMPGAGITSERLGNACVWSLAALPEGAGVPYLARVLSRTKYPKIKSKIDAKLNEAASAARITRGVLDELSVPTHDLDENGCFRQKLTDGEAIIRIEGSRKVTIDWFGLGGKPLKAPSAAMKADKETLKAVREAAKELEADLSIQPARLQRLYFEDRRWTADEWLGRYLMHPLVRPLASRLIWWVESAEGDRVAAVADEAGQNLCDVTGTVVSLEGAMIRLWHPMETTVEAVEAWRGRLEALEIVQPFAQAWREVYALTDAERATGTYSNRWAAHILRQHQAMTLARINGWRVTHRMCVDAPNDEPWHLAIPAHGLVADYWVEGAGGDSPDITDSCAYVYVTTDRLQFHAINADAPDSARGPVRERAIPLAEIPPLIFSEVMRQADLFTAVSSIAADTNWLDRGQDAAHPTQWGQQADVYWTQTNTTALMESGKLRKAVLQRIVSRLAIAEKLGIDDNYLTVEGTRHHYRIHLGSGACFRGGRHICIVPKAAQGERIWLPFEGDKTLSIIISKALLLAADDKITDPVILRQL